MIGSIAGNMQRHVLNNDIIGKTLDTINHSTASFGVGMKASYNFQHGVMAVAYAGDPVGFSTDFSTAGKMSDVDLYTGTLDRINANITGFNSDYDFQKSILGVAYSARGAGGIVNATA